MAQKIFINYRRGDDPGFTRALYLHLQLEGGFELFMDVEGDIKPGDDYIAVLTAQVAACNVLLAVIGPRWANLLAERAGDPGDWVAIEIEAALRHGKRVIPVLVGGAAMPPAEMLPERIRPLARLQAVSLRPDAGFQTDCQRLVRSLKDHFASVEQESAARAEAERAAAEAEHRKRATEAAARRAEAELKLPPTSGRPVYLAGFGLGLGLSILGAFLIYWLASTSPPPVPSPPPSVTSPIAPPPEPPALAARDPAPSVLPGSGKSFRDSLADGHPCSYCPEMVVVPSGSFTMGSPPGEDGRFHTGDPGDPRPARCPPEVS
jgi:hypothetical protein